jgi:hypothetical protein
MMRHRSFVVLTALVASACFALVSLHGCSSTTTSGQQNVSTGPCCNVDGGNAGAYFTCTCTSPPSVTPPVTVTTSGSSCTITEDDELPDGGAQVYVGGVVVTSCPN